MTQVTVEQTHDNRVARLQELRRRVANIQISSEIAELVEAVQDLVDLSLVAQDDEVFDGATELMMELAGGSDEAADMLNRGY